MRSLLNIYFTKKVSEKTESPEAIIFGPGQFKYLLTAFDIKIVSVRRISIYFRDEVNQDVLRKNDEFLMEIAMMANKV